MDINKKINGLFGTILVLVMFSLVILVFYMAFSAPM